jgi:hypothetical protein
MPTISPARLKAFSILLIRNVWFFFLCFFSNFVVCVLGCFFGLGFVLFAG